FCTFIASFGSSVRQYRQQNFFWVEGLKIGILGAVGVTLGKQVITSSYYSQTEFVLLFSLLLLYVSYMFYRRGSSAGTPAASDELLGWRHAGITGGAGGFIAALAGIGGGGVMVPIMNLYYKQPFQKAVSVSSLAIVFISLSGWLQLAFTRTADTAYTAYYIGYVDFGAALPLALGGLAGGFIGAWITLKIERRYLQYGFALLAIAMAVRLLTEVF
ncbi:MAG: sulfite exporter TauE/SafE family protein, partial [Balneolaceae bacterium]|nr:sulfite exporter TauE/SafE family protein [Balneolaceae bacterium]